MGTGTPDHYEGIIMHTQCISMGMARPAPHTIRVPYNYDFLTDSFYFLFLSILNLSLFIIISVVLGAPLLNFASNLL